MLLSPSYKLLQALFYLVLHAKTLVVTKSIPTHARQTKSTARIHPRAAGQRIHLPVEKPICSTILLYKEKRWQTTTSPRLPTPKRMDHQKPLPITPNLQTYSMHSERKEIHQSRHPVGVQQCTHQGRGRTQGCVHHKPRAV